MKRITIYIGYLVLCVLLYMSELSIVPTAFARYQFTSATILYIAGNLFLVFYLFFLRDCAVLCSVKMNSILLGVTLVITAVVFHWFPTGFDYALFLLAEELYTTVTGIVQKRKA